MPRSDLMLRALTGRVANRQSSQNADISLPLCGGLPAGESTLQRLISYSCHMKICLTHWFDNSTYLNRKIQ